MSLSLAPSMQALGSPKSLSPLGIHPSTFLVFFHTLFTSEGSGTRWAAALIISFIFEGVSAEERSIVSSTPQSYWAIM